MLVPADPPAQLVEVGQAEVVRLVDDDRIGRRNVQARLDDRGADQDVRLAPQELEHDLFKLMAGHLAVAHDNTGVRGQLLHLFGHALNIVNAVMHKIDLTVAAQFADQGPADAFPVVRDHLGHDGPAIQRSGGQGADVAQTQHGHMQRARNRRGGERQHISGQAELQQLLLVFHAEALLFVDYHQPQVGKTHVLAEHAVCADDHVDFAALQGREGLGLLAGGLEPADRLDAERVVGHPAAEGAFVLLRQHGGRHEHGRLLAELDGFEGGADGHFRLAEAHVAADKAVHRLLVGHVFLHFGDGGQLVVGFLVGKLGLKLMLPGAYPAESARRASTLAPPGCAASGRPGP